MSERFKGLVKLPKEPAAKLLSQANILIKTPLLAPASAAPEQVLTELESKKAWFDLLLVMAVLLPPRERVWWACLAARDYIGPKSPADPQPLTASEAWVFKPTDENRDVARHSLDNAYVDDDTTNCANAVVYSDGTLGPGDLAQYPAPAGAAELHAYAMNMVALNMLSDKFDAQIQLMIDRAVDIARGGNGHVKPAKELEGEV
ncbi:DUF6931 family protein [Albibacillus kandeliae]|uniref:DUF6931 family protein n=1 Tax=Albibacillus kandeliae TaxID=2174228 RepID=UPI000D68E49D|nr:hypothetical protein [Albibacillus kandeliae]